MVDDAERRIPDHASSRDAPEALDGVEEGLIRLRSGFSGGAPVRFWDFGEASPNAIPLYLLVKLADGGALATPEGDFNPIAHKPIFDAIPGDAVYSPWWTVVLLRRLRALLRMPLLLRFILLTLLALLASTLSA